MRNRAGWQPAEAPMAGDVLRHLEFAATPRADSLLIEASHLYTIAGEAALSAGRSGPAIAMLTRARDILACIDDSAASAHALELLLAALAEAGQAATAHGLTAEVDEMECAGLETERLARMRLQLARADAVANEPVRGIIRVRDARALLTAPGRHPVGAALDAVEAGLIAQTSPDRSDQAAEGLARRALAAAVTSDQPQVACDAWEVLGILARRHDLADSTACFQRARVLAHRDRLPFCRLRAQLGLGINEWLTTGETHRLETLRRVAALSGSLAVACSADTVLSLSLIFRGRYAEAGQLIDQCRAQADPAGLTGTLRWLTLAQAVLAAHQGKRPEMETALREFGHLGGDGSRLAPSALSLAQAVCALLEENRELAYEQLHQAASRSAACPGPYPHAGREGLYEFLASLRQADTVNLTITTKDAPFWNVPLGLLAQAVTLGRNGLEAEALAVLAEAEQAAAPYELLHQLGLRLVAEAAYRDGWGSPATWLRRAEQYFHDRPGSAVANACRSLLRQLGAPLPYRRQDAERIPQMLRVLGVTGREFDVLTVFTTGAGNKEIAAELYISPRTVEKHIASLLARTSQPDRTRLIGFVRAVLHAGNDPASVTCDHAT